MSSIFTISRRHLVNVRPFARCRRYKCGRYLCMLLIFTVSSFSGVLTQMVPHRLLYEVLSYLSSNMSSADSAECRESPATDPDNWKTSQNSLGLLSNNLVE